MFCANNVNLSRDPSTISLRYGVSPIYRKDMTLDATLYIFRCESISAIDLYLFNESSEGVNRSEKKMIDDLVLYEDGLLVRDDLSALDTLLTNMILMGKDCLTLQG